MIDLYYAEDDETVAQAVKEYLEQENFRVTVFSMLAGMKQALRSRQPEGSELCGWLRARWPWLPVIFLTVRGDSHDVVGGFQKGADDYVVKPFELEVLHSRILALLRRTGQVKVNCYHCDSLTLDMDKMSVFCDGEELVLSQPEYQILLLLMENKGKTVTRKQLLEKVWDSNGNYVNDNTLTVTIKRLREKLHQPACLKTIRSFGYRMEDTL